MTHHMWVAIQYTPIEIEPVFKDGDIASLHTYTTELGDEVAREDSTLCCWHCNSPLTVESYQSECTAAANPPHNFEQNRREP